MTLSLSSSVRWRRVGEEGVVLNQNSSEVLVLNSLGMRIIELLDQSMSVDQMIDTLLLEYDVEPSVLRHDVRDFLHQLIEADLAHR